MPHFFCGIGTEVGFHLGQHIAFDICNILLVCCLSLLYRGGNGLALAGKGICAGSIIYITFQHNIFDYRSGTNREVCIAITWNSFCTIGNIHLEGVDITGSSCQIGHYRTS
ncbi:hypothetical protein D3C86_1855980 [compost metagenome]